MSIELEKTKNTQLNIFAIAICTLLLASNVSYIISISPQTHSINNKTNWINIATTAWNYFQPGTGVDNQTGLCYPTPENHKFTDQNIATYISAIIAAQRLNLFPRNGSWGADARIDKIINYLRTRPISIDNLPYAEYNVENGSPSNIQDTVLPQDFAKLLIALETLENYRPDLAKEIGKIINRYNIYRLSQSQYFTIEDFYSAYLSTGYQAFGFTIPNLKDPKVINKNMPKVDPFNITNSWIKLKPIILSILEDHTNKTLKEIVDNTFSVYDEQYILEENQNLKDNKMWTSFSSTTFAQAEIYCTQIAHSIHAIYNNKYTQKVANQIQQLSTSRGFLELIPKGNITTYELTDETNQITLQAAYYATLIKPTLITYSPTNFPRYAITTFVLSPENINQQIQLLKQIGAYNTTIVTRESETDKFQTVYNAAKDISDCIIPEFAYMQTLPPLEREGVIDARIHQFQRAGGKNPLGIFSFQTDTHTLNYLKNKFNVTYAIGNVWDQINMDSMSMRGSFSTPYYASQKNSLIPEITSQDGSMLILTPFTIAPTNRYHADYNHIIDLYQQNIDMQEFKYTTRNHPFYSPFFLELDWLIALNDADLIRLFKENYKWVYQNFEVITAQQYTSLFRQQYPTTPTYHFTYASSNVAVFRETNGQIIEWVMNPNRRVARINNQVISAIDYGIQNLDPYLTINKTINLNGSIFGEDQNNIIDTSLTFSVDAIWQSQFGDRTLSKKNPAIYIGSLEKFQINSP